MSQESPTPGDYEVGRFYRVPCIKATGHLWCGSGWLPVIGPEHEDSGAVNFPHQHFHIDWRFVSDAVFRQSAARGAPERVLGIPLMRSDMNGKAIIEGAPVLRRRKCRRPMPNYPRVQALRAWLPKLEAEFAGHKLKGMVCPHRGLPLHGCETDGDVVTCPGHGLRWNFKTGALVVGESPSTCDE